MTDHPPLGTLRDFADGLLQPDDMATVAIHVAGCASCRKRANREEQTDSPYAGAIRRVADRATRREARFGQEKRRAPSDLARILALPTDEWNHAVRSSPRYHSYAFARRALAASKAGWGDDPYRSERLAELGLFVADRLSHAEHGRRNLNDLRSKAWAYIGNTRRIQGSFAEVPDSLEAAVELHQRGSGIGKDRMQLMSFLRSFLTCTNRFPEALDLLGELDAMANGMDSRYERGRNFWARGRIEILRGSVDAAIENLTIATRIFADSETDKHSRVRLACSLASSLSRAGRTQSAILALRSVGPQDLLASGQLDRLFFRWCHGRVLRSAGALGIAEKVILGCRETLLRSRLTVDAAYADLDLALIREESGQLDEARDTAFRALPVFAFHGIAEGTTMTLDLFRRAGGLS